MNDVTRILASFIVDARLDDLPDGVVHEAKRSLLHWIGCAVGGSQEPSVVRALSTVAEFSGRPQASVLGRQERLDILLAALINGISTDVLSFGDTHPETLIHPTGVIGPAVLALAERNRTSGKALLHALILGFEVASRVSLAVYPWHYTRGWHITGTAGVFGAAAAAGKLLGLDERRLTWALGIAATQAAGLREMFGSMCKNLHTGHAARNGLLAAFLAKNDFTSSDNGIGAPRGFAHVLGEPPNLACITNGLGETYEILKNTYKPFPCGVVIHPVIDGCLFLRTSHRVDPDRIRCITLRVNPLVVELTGRKDPVSTLEGKLSVYHSAAAAFIAGKVGEQEYRPEFIASSDTVALRKKVSARIDEAIREDEAEISIELADGTTLHHHVDHATGSAQRPMSDGDMEDKLRGLCEPLLTKDRTLQLMEACWRVTEIDDASILASLARRD
ncbi:MAG: MmgE/PrpD family protein [Betaproteobacteria bacterium]|nr:MmgE/PrpD family protein [Betaproteobacteria bacterium]